MFHANPGWRCRRVRSERFCFIEGSISFRIASVNSYLKNLHRNPLWRGARLDLPRGAGTMKARGVPDSVGRTFHGPPIARRLRGKATFGSGGAAVRLFIAINFDPATKEKLLDIQLRLSACASGNFTKPENLHLTVAFLGEVGEAAAIKRAVSDRFVQPVELEFDRVGTFRRDLYWVGVKPGPALDDLYRSWWGRPQAGGVLRRLAGPPRPAHHAGTGGVAARPAGPRLRALRHDRPAAEPDEVRADRRLARLYGGFRQERLTLRLTDRRPQIRRTLFVCRGDGRPLAVRNGRDCHESCASARRGGGPQPY